MNNIEFGPEPGVFKRVHKPEPTRKKVLFKPPSRRDIITAAVIFTVSRAGILGMHPFGAAAFAAMMDGRTAYIGMLASALGLVSAGTGTEAVKYLLAMLIFLLFALIREDYRTHIIISSAVCGGAVAVGGAAQLALTSVTAYDILLLLAESVIAAFMYVVFFRFAALSLSRRRRLSQEEILCFCIGIAVVIMGFSGVYLPFGLRLTILLSAYAVMLLAMNTSLSVSGAGALAAGLICGAGGTDMSGLMGLYGLCGLSAQMLSAFGRCGAVTGFMASCALVILCEGSTNELPISIAEMLGAVILIMLTPKRINNKIKEFFDKSTSLAVRDINERVKQILSEKINAAATAFSNIALRFEGLGCREEENGRDNIVRQTMDKQCAVCGMYCYCVKRKYRKTYDYIYKMLLIIEEKGRLRARTLPDDMSEYCVNIENLVRELTHIYEMSREKEVHKNELMQQKRLTAMQYGETARMLRKLSETVRHDFEFMASAEAGIAEELDKIGIAADIVQVMPEGNFGVSADIIGSWREDKLIAAVSEVMDTDMEVREVSGGTVVLSERCNIEIDVGMSQACRSGNEVCGDSIMRFGSDDVRCVFALCDGMGSGEGAKAESNFAVGLIYDFMMAGFDKNVGMNMINYAMTLYSDSEAFSTVDLLVIDKNMQTAEFIKLGAAESYFITDSTAEVIYSLSLPVGMVSDAAADVQKRALKPGDIIVMLSDGVSGACSEEVIKKLRLSCGMTAQAMAERIIRAAGEPADDMSVIVVKVL